MMLNIDVKYKFSNILSNLAISYIMRDDMNVKSIKRGMGYIIQFRLSPLTMIRAGFVGGYVPNERSVNAIIIVYHYYCLLELLLPNSYLSFELPIILPILS